MEGACVCGNEPWCYIKCGEISGLAEDLLPSQKGICSMELIKEVSYIVMSMWIPAIPNVQKTWYEYQSIQ